jgi:hypothetical protein
VGRRGRLALAAVATVALAACGGDDDSDKAGSADGGPGGAIATVHAVPPLEPLVSDLLEAYNQASDTGIELAVAAQEDVVKAVSRGMAAILPGAWLEDIDADSVVLGRNLAIIVVPAGNPAEVTGVDAFAPASGPDTAICGANTSIGNFGTLVLALGGVRPDPGRVAEGCDAEAAARVARGELHAALVFRTYVPIPESAEVISIPDEQNIVIDVRYVPAMPDANTDSFQGFLASDPAKQILSRQGFLP